MVVSLLFCCRYYIPEFIYIYTESNPPPATARKIRGWIDKHVFRFRYRKGFAIRMSYKRGKDNARYNIRALTLLRTILTGNESFHEFFDSKKKKFNWFARARFDYSIHRNHKPFPFKKPCAEFKLLSKQRFALPQRWTIKLAQTGRIKLQVKSAGFTMVSIICRLHSGIFSVYDAQKISGGRGGGRQ